MIFFYDVQNRLIQYDFFNSQNIKTLFNTYHYTDGDKKVDIFKRFITQTDTGVPGLTDSVRYTYNAAGQLIETTRYAPPNDSLISSTKFFSYDENGRLKTVTRPDNDRTEFFYSSNGNMVRREKSFINQDTGEFELTLIQSRVQVINATQRCFSLGSQIDW